MVVLPAGNDLGEKTASRFVVKCSGGIYVNSIEGCDGIRT
jgi:hypothetical protein